MEEALTEFQTYWPKLLQTIRSNKTYEDISESIDWLERLLKYNVPHGKLLRGLTLLTIYRDLVPNRTTKQDELSYLIAWCVEIMQTAYLVADDIMDDSETRRGQPCWYRLPDVGTMAVNDTLFLENLVYELILCSVKDPTLKMNLISTFSQTSYKTILGQSLDTQMSRKKNYEKFTTGVYSAIVKYKTSFYTIYQPAALALILAGKAEARHLQVVEQFSIELGYLFQAQDDWIDCYTNPEVSGKIGTDIIDGKCTWLAVTALNRANLEQRRTFEAYYGVKDKKAEAIIKNLYIELNISETFQKFQLDSYEKILSKLDEFPPDIPKTPFTNLLNRLYKREK